MSLTGVLLRHDSQAEITIMKLEENMGGGRARRGPGHRSRSPKARCERGAQGKSVRVVEAMCIGGAVARLEPDYRNDMHRKEQFPTAWAAV